MQHPPRPARRPLLALLALALLGAPAAALEPEELRLGMSELDAVAVFTRYRSCENAALEEGPGLLAWRAGLHGREARVELGLAEGRLVSIAYRYPLGEAEEGEGLFETLLSGLLAELGPPARRGAFSALWEGVSGAALLERAEAEGGREIRLELGEGAR